LNLEGGICCYTKVFVLDLT